MPVKIINFSNSVLDATFPSELKNAVVISIFKKKDRNNVEQYRPVIILPNLQKIYERCLYAQMYKYFNHILSKWQCRFRKDFSTQHCLLVMTEMWWKCLDERGYKWGYINRSLKSLWLYCARPFNSQTCCRWFWLPVSQNHGVFFPIHNKEQKLQMPLVVTLKLYMEFHKSQFWVPYFLISIPETYFLT